MSNKLKNKIRRYSPKFINLDIFYEIQIGDCKTGKILSTKKGRCYSFVKQFLQTLLATMRGSIIYFTAVDDTNTTRNRIYGGGVGGTMGVVNNATYGIVVGTGTTAATINDYALQTKIAHGTGAGQLQYSAQTAGAPTSDSTSSYFILTRVFTNNSGSSITVNEIGLLAQYYDQDFGNSIYLLFLRDVISARTILNGQFLTVNYTFKAIA